MHDQPTTETITRALRSVRPSVYRLDDHGGEPTLTLVLAASEAGRRNAAERVVRALATAGLAVAHDEPVEALVAGRRLAVRARSRSGG